MRVTRVGLGLVLLLCVALAGCGGNRLSTVDQAVELIEQQGVSTSLAGDIYPPLQIEGERYYMTVPGVDESSEIAVYVDANKSVTARSDRKALVEDDGKGKIRTITRPGDVALVVFRRDDIIVIAYSSNPKVLDPLSRVLGPPIATL